MSVTEIISVVMVVICAIVAGFMFYYRVRGNVFGAVSELIAIAETTGLAGPEKMAQVVASLAKMVPAWLRKVLTDKRLEKIAQWVFDWTRKYADEYRKKLAASPDGELTEEETDALGASAAADLISSLFNMTKEPLKKKAEEYGVKLEGAETNKDIIEAIVLAVLNKV